MKTLVTGARGMLAKDLAPLLSRRGHEVLALPREMLDKTDLEAVRYAVEGFGPEFVVNCAAYSSVDDAEQEEGQALMVNSFGVQNLCLVCQENDIALVQFSTAHVFGGRKVTPYMVYDDPNPLGAYGRSKLMGDKICTVASEEVLPDSHDLAVWGAWHELWRHHARDWSQTEEDLGGARPDGMSDLDVPSSRGSR